MSKPRKKSDIERRRGVRDGEDFAVWFSKRPFTEGVIFEISCPSEMPPIRLDRVIRESIDECSWSRSRAFIENGKSSIDGEIVREIARLVRGGSVVCVDPKARKPQNHLTDLVRLVYWDSQVVVVDKPSGISTVPFDEHETDTLDELTRRALGKVLSSRLPPLGVVHRIDKDTSGIVVFARTTAAKRHLKQQFRFHTNSRIYLALVRGQPRSERIESRIIEDRGDGRRGSTTHPTLGQNAITYVDVIEAYKTASLVRCRLETGRTHQIRIHLSERGHPILGDRVYGRSSVESLPPVPRLMLHAMELGFEHPTRGERMTFRSDLPEEFVRVLDGLKNT